MIVETLDEDGRAAMNRAIRLQFIGVRCAVLYVALLGMLALWLALSFRWDSAEGIPLSFSGMEWVWLCLILYCLVAAFVLARVPRLVSWGLVAAAFCSFVAPLVRFCFRGPGLYDDWYGEWMMHTTVWLPAGIAMVLSALLGIRAVSRPLAADNLRRAVIRSAGGLCLLAGAVTVPVGFVFAVLIVFALNGDGGEPSNWLVPLPLLMPIIVPALPFISFTALEKGAFRWAVRLVAVGIAASLSWLPLLFFIFHDFSWCNGFVILAMWVYFGTPPLIAAEVLLLRARRKGLGEVEDATSCVRSHGSTTASA